MKICAALVVALCIFCSPMHAEQTIFLVGPEHPPLEFTTPNGTPSGYNVEVVREALRRIGYKAIIRLYPWNRAMAMVYNGKADGILDAASTENRTYFLIYPETPIHVEEYYAYQPVTSNIRLSPDLSNARGLCVGLLKGAAYGPRLERLLAKDIFSRIEYTVVPEQHIPKLLNKRMDIMIGQGPPGERMAPRAGVPPTIKPVLSTLDGKPLLISISKTYLAFSRKKIPQELVDKFDMALKEMQAEGYMKKMQEKYE